jgi:hypothetical protein
MIRTLACVLTGMMVAGCGGPDAPPDYVKIIGGGLTFNSRYSEATMVVVAKQVTPLPEGSRLEARFEHPGRMEREIESAPARPGKLTYKFQSEPLTGITNGMVLHVSLHVFDASGKELDNAETQFTSDVDQSTLPSKPLVRPDVPNYVPQLENL